MKWFIPTWNGDLRLIPEGDDKTKLVIEKPTPHEIQVLEAMGKVFLEKNLVKSWDVKLSRLRKSKSVVVDAPLETVGPIVSKLMRPGKAVLTAITFKDGKIVTSSGDEAEIAAVAEEAAKKGDAEAAATVKRPTPSCPQCEPGAIKPATEVLLAFLSAEQHKTWARDRYVVVEGGLTGNRYVLAHRHSALGQRIGRVAFDLDDRCVVHFHDRSVPPEEEVLAAKLILEHREPWLRNEATMLGLKPGGFVFKNPFGGLMDGTESAALTSGIGAGVLGGLLGTWS